MVDPQVVARLDVYKDLFQSIAATEKVSPAWLQGIAAAESGGHADEGKGSSGYKGLLQCEKTEDQLDPATSIRAGAVKVRQFLATLTRLLAPYGVNLGAADEWTQLSWVLCGYNAGPGVVQRAVKAAHEAGDTSKWMDPQYYIPALVYYGSYSTRAYAGGATQEQIDLAEKWRLELEKYCKASSDPVPVTLSDLTDKTFDFFGSYDHVPALVVKAVQMKMAHTPGYVNTAVSYAQFFARRDAPEVS